MWQDKAACKDMRTETFFPHREDNEKHAIKICQKCPVKCECLDYALKHRIEHGIWGGMGIRARNRIRRQRKAS